MYHATVLPVTQREKTTNKVESNTSKGYTDSWAAHRLPKHVFVGVWTQKGSAFFGQKRHVFLEKMYCLVGGWTNPFEKYARQKWVHLPQVGMKIKNIWVATTQIGFVLEMLIANLYWLVVSSHLEESELVGLDHFPRDRGRNFKNIWVATT